MTTVAFFVVIAAIGALLVVGIEDIGSGHVVFANRGINVQTSTSQDQGCEPAGGTSGITNACTATSGSGPTQTSVTLSLLAPCMRFNCSVFNCNNIGCTSVSCDFPLSEGPGNCTTDNGVQLTSCIINQFPFLSCTRSEPGTGITNSGGVTGGDAG